MKNYELLDIIGDVNEDYVLAADSHVARPRFRWKPLAVCAACAALVLCAYPVWLGGQSNSSPADNALPAGGAEPQLHAYTVVEGDGTFTSYDEEAAPADEPGMGNGTVAAGPRADSDNQNEDDLTMDNAPCEPGDIPVQPSAEWYDALLRTYRLEENPEWYGGAWLAGDDLLAVAIVDGFRTPELETEIKEAAGAGAVLQFSTVKYSMEFLNGLMEPAVRALDGSGLCAGVGVDMMANCLGVDLYGDSETVPDSVLAALAHLDPDGDAIRVQLFVGTLSAYDETAMKNPAPGAVSTPVLRDDREYPAEDLPEARYDVIYGDES